MNLLQCYAEVPPVAQMTGYEMKTTFWGDFRVCMLDENAIKDTYKRAFQNWKDDKVYATELALVLNWLSWYYEKVPNICRLYVDLWHKMDAYIMKNWKDDKEKLSYYLRTTD